MAYIDIKVILKLSTTINSIELTYLYTWNKF